MAVQWLIIIICTLHTSSTKLLLYYKFSDTLKKETGWNCSNWVITRALCMVFWTEWYEVLREILNDKFQKSNKYLDRVSCNVPILGIAEYQYFSTRTPTLICCVAPFWQCPWVTLHACGETYTFMNTEQLSRFLLIETLTRTCTRTCHRNTSQNSRSAYKTFSKLSFECSTFFTNNQTVALFKYLNLIG